MLRDILIWSTVPIHFLTAIFLITFWFVARKRYSTGAIPWLIAYGVADWVTRILTNAVLHGANITTAMDAIFYGSAAEVEAADVISQLTTWFIFNAGIQTPLIALLILSNIAAVLPDGPRESRIWRFFVGAYRWRWLLGIMLLASAAAGSLSNWWTVWYLQSLVAR